MRGLTPRLAAWRPRRGRHNIWELVVHAAYWKYAARRWLSGDETRSFPLEGSNFWVRPVRAGRLDPDLLRADIRLLDEMHRLLLETVSGIPVTLLHRRLGKGKETRFGLIAGVAAHDLYHAGQIQLIKALNSGR